MTEIEKRPAPIYRLELSPLPSCPDPVRALRGLLKVALRRYGLRALSAIEARE